MTDTIRLMKFLSGVATRSGMGNHAFVVGGAVRDHLLGREIKDVDVVVDSVNGPLDSEAFGQEIKRAVSATIATNRFGVAIVTIRSGEFAGEIVEIANARAETFEGGSVKGHKPSMVKAATIKEDVIRRDFTINTLMFKLGDLANGPDGAEVIDLTGRGVSDLKTMVLRCPSDPDQTFSDDPTRMLRAVKFSARFAAGITNETREAIVRNSGKIQDVPFEAAAALFETIVSSSGRRGALSLLVDLGLISNLDEMLKGSKPFQSRMANFLATLPVALALEVASNFHNLDAFPGSFLGDEFGRFKEIVFSLSDATAAVFLSSLDKPIINNKVLIDEFCLKGAACGQLRSKARLALLSRPELAGNALALTAAVRELIS